MLCTLSCIGRGLQLNAGAAGSEHKLLLFLHIDTVLPIHFDTMAWHTLLIPGVTAGAFQFGLVVHMKEKRYSKYNVQECVYSLDTHWTRIIVFNVLYEYTCVLHAGSTNHGGFYSR